MGNDVMTSGSLYCHMAATLSSQQHGTKKGNLEDANKF